MSEKEQSELTSEELRDQLRQSVFEYFANFRRMSSTNRLMRDKIAQNLYLARQHSDGKVQRMADSTVLFIGELRTDYPNHFGGELKRLLDENINLESAVDPQ